MDSDRRQRQTPPTARTRPPKWPSLLQRRRLPQPPLVVPASPTTSRRSPTPPWLALAAETVLLQLPARRNRADTTTTRSDRHRRRGNGSRTNAESRRRPKRDDGGTRNGDGRARRSDDEAGLVRLPYVATLAAAVDKIVVDPPPRPRGRTRTAVRQGPKARNRPQMAAGGQGVPRKTTSEPERRFRAER